MNDDIGQKIIDEIIKQRMVEARFFPDDKVLFVWSANAAEQLSALVEEHYQRGEPT